MILYKSDCIKPRDCYMYTYIFTYTQCYFSGFYLIFDKDPIIILRHINTTYSFEIDISCIILAKTINIKFICVYTFTLPIYYNI